MVVILLMNMSSANKSSFIILVFESAEMIWLIMCIWNPSRELHLLLKVITSSLCSYELLNTPDCSIPSLGIDLKWASWIKSHIGTIVLHVYHKFATQIASWQNSVNYHHRAYIDTLCVKLHIVYKMSQSFENQSNVIFCVQIYTQCVSVILHTVCNFVHNV